MKPRILVLTTSYPRFSGDYAGHFVEAEVEDLRAHGHEVTVLAAGSRRAGDIAAPADFYLGGATLFDHPGAWSRLQQNPARLLDFIPPTLRILAHKRKLASTRVDRVIAHWLFPSGLPWATLLVPRDVPVEIVAHGSDLRLLQTFPLPLQQAFFSFLAARGVSLRFVSAAQKHALLATPLQRGARTLIENAVIRPPTLSTSVALPKPHLRRELNLKGGALVALVVGRLIPSKRIETALAAAALVPHLQTYVIGRGPLEAHLRARFPEVRFLGSRPRQEVLVWMRAADLVISASRHEGAPTVVREARLLDTPVVASACSDLDVWARTDTGLWAVD